MFSYRFTPATEYRRGENQRLEAPPQNWGVESQLVEQAPYRFKQWRHWYGCGETKNTYRSRHPEKRGVCAFQSKYSGLQADPHCFSPIDPMQ
jgi:hypothetical protein